jgi:hypothetical protein
MIIFRTRKATDRTVTYVSELVHLHRRRVLETERLSSEHADGLGWAQPR